MKLLVTRVNVYTNGLFYTQVAEIKATAPLELKNSLRIHWTAPGDDGSIGTATSYDLRWSTSPIPTDISVDAFGALPEVPGVNETAPQPAGQQEEILFQDLEDEADYYFALKAVRQRG